MRTVLVIATGYLSWLLMLGFHELGHVLHAWLSGGAVAHVELPLLGFSRTDLAQNPRPLAVAWGGAVWGVLLPLAGLALARGGWWAIGRSTGVRAARPVSRDPVSAGSARVLCSAEPGGFRGWYVLQFMAGFCLVSNGAYLAGGSLADVGDAGDLVRHGAARWHLLLYAAVTVPAGLWLWNGLGRHFGLGRGRREVDRGVIAVVVAAVVLLCAGYVVAG